MVRLNQCCMVKLELGLVSQTFISHCQQATVLSRTRGHFVYYIYHQRLGKYKAVSVSNKDPPTATLIGKNFGLCML